MATSSTHRWTHEFGDYEGVSVGIVPEFEKTKENAKDWKEVIERIQEKFLDDVFDVNSKVERKEFINTVAKKQTFLFKPSEIKKMVIEEFKKL